MIYDKEVSFPYPILSFLSNDYIDNNFELYLSPLENNDYFEFKIDYQMSSDFIKKLIDDKLARIYLLISTKDSKFFEVDLITSTVKIHRSRITLNTRSFFQLAVVSATHLNYEQNNDLIDDYSEIKREINIDKNQIIALSNIERFDGEIKKPYQLFISQVDPNLKSAVKISIEDEFIYIKVRDQELLYKSFVRRKELNYHYVYLGLQKALLQFLIDEKTEQILIDEQDESNDPFFRKLHRFLKIKRIKRVSLDDIDLIISIISDQIVEKHFKVIKELNERDN